MPDPEEPIEIPIEDAIDLHPFLPRETADVAEEYLRAAREKGFTQVRLIHGRGMGVQRRIIRSLLDRLDFVESYADADSSGGGWGATVVVLKPADDTARLLTPDS